MGSSLESAKRCSCCPKYLCQRESPVKLWFPVSAIKCIGISGSSLLTHSAAPMSCTRIAANYDKGRSSSRFMHFSKLLSLQSISHCNTGDNPNSSAASVREIRESVSNLPIRLKVLCSNITSRIEVSLINFSVLLLSR